MAKLATLLNRFEAAEIPHAAHADKAGYQVRPIPNEDVYFYCKPIDNSRISRVTDAQERGKRLKAIAVCSMMAFVLMAAAAPHVWVVMDGYKIEALKQEKSRLEQERASLDLEVAKLLSPARLEQLAHDQQFVDPAPGQVVYLNPKPDGTLAIGVPEPEASRRSGDEHP